MAHATHAMGAHVAEFKARAVTDTSCGGHPRSVASADVRGALAMDRRALAMDCRGAFPMNAAALAVDGLRVPRMRRCLAGSVCVAYKPAEIQAVIMRNFSPALPRLVQCDDAVEALACGIRQ